MEEHRACRKMPNGLGGQQYRSSIKETKRHGEHDHKKVKRREKIRKIKEN